MRFAGIQAVVSASALGFLTLFATGRASGQETVTVQQDGANVLVSGSGTIDTAALTLLGYVTREDEVAGEDGLVGFGSSDLEAAYLGITGPTSFGSGSDESASSSTGDTFGIEGSVGYILLPVGYISGSELSGTLTFDDTTIAALGLTDGTYTYTWGSGASADSLTVDIGGSVVTPPAAAPEPSSLALLGSGVLGLAGVLRRRMRR